MYNLKHEIKYRYYPNDIEITISVTHTNISLVDILVFRKTNNFIINYSRTYSGSLVYNPNTVVDYLIEHSLCKVLEVERLNTPPYQDVVIYTLTLDPSIMLNLL